jgi:hypothetical protein
VPLRPQRPLAVVGVLAFGDYLLWNWSLGANHDVLALVCGMTLIPLLIALVWLLLVAVVRLIGHVAQRFSAGTGARATHARADARAGGRRSRGTRVGVAAESTPGATGPGLDDTAAGRAAASPSSKLAA